MHYACITEGFLNLHLNHLERASLPALLKASSICTSTILREHRCSHSITNGSASARFLAKAALSEMEE
jgi:hypothetical protein